MWFWLTLASTVFGAIDVIISKKVLHKVSPAVLSWSFFALTVPILFFLSLREGIPNINTIFFMTTIGSSFIYIFSRMISNNVLKQNLISKILPLSAFNGLFTYVFGLIFLSESLRLLPVLGLIFIVIGAYILNVDQAREDFLKPFKLLFGEKHSMLFLLAIMFSSLAVIFDKSALNNTFPSSPVFTMLVEQTMMSVIIGMYMFKKEKNTWVNELKENFWLLFLNSLVFLGGGLFVFYAYSFGGPVALVVGIRRIQIFFILLMSYLFFEDKPTRHVWAATAIMILGVLLIKLG